MPKIFSSFCPVSIRSQKKKKGHRADGGIFFSDFMLISKKKKEVLRLRSASFLRALCDIQEARRREPQLSMVYGARKNAGIRKISVRRCQKKFRTFLRLKGTLVWTHGSLRHKYLKLDLNFTTALVT